MGRIPISAVFLLILFLIAAGFSGDLLAQDSSRSQSQPAISKPDPSDAQDIRTTRQKWQNFVDETVLPLHPEQVHSTPPFLS